jgi:hypothetical protein
MGRGVSRDRSSSQRPCFRRRARATQGSKYNALQDCRRPHHTLRAHSPGDAGRGWTTSTQSRDVLRMTIGPMDAIKAGSIYRSTRLPHGRTGSLFSDRFANRDVHFQWPSSAHSCRIWLTRSSVCPLRAAAYLGLSLTISAQRHSPMSQIRCRKCRQYFSPVASKQCPKCGDTDPHRFRKAAVELSLGTLALAGAMGIVFLAVTTPIHP